MDWSSEWLMYIEVYNECFTWYIVILWGMGNKTIVKEQQCNNVEIDVEKNTELKKKKLWQITILFLLFINKW